MKLNVDKCKVMHFGRTNNRDKYFMEDLSGKWNYGIRRSKLGDADRKCCQESKRNTWYAKKDILQ